MWGKQKAEETIQCSLVKAPDIYIEPTPRQKIQLLMDEYKNQEWLAYLRGRVSKKENIFVEDIEVPPHKEANGASAEAEPFHVPEDCVGIIHSHHTMGAFHSGTDQSYVDKNYPVSITVARNTNELVFDAVSYQQTPCGKGVTLKCTVKYVQPPALFDQESFLKQAKGNIEKSKTPVLGAIYPRHNVKPLPYSGFVDKQEGDTYYTDDRGHVLSQKELDKLTASIWGD